MVIWVFKRKRTMKSIFTTIIFSILTAVVFANKVSGKLMLSDGMVGEFANILLLSSKDSSLIKGTLVTQDGLFEITDIAQGSYILSATLVGYDKLYQEIKMTEAPIDLGTLTLSKTSMELKEVVVKAQKPLFELKSDKMVMNVENNINSTGLNALELLRKAPGVQLDSDERVQLKNKNGVLIYIDGKPSVLTQRDLTAYLRGLQASDIEAIEIISNPSAKYDAAGNAGIINIRLKRNKNYGTNGNASLGLNFGITPKLNTSLSLNNRNAKWNIFGNASYYNGEKQNSLKLYREQAGRVYDQTNININDDVRVNAKAGAEYSINTKNSVSAILTGSYSDDLWKSNSKSYISNIANKFKPDSLLIATNRIAGHSMNMNGNLNYTYKDTSGTEFSIDANVGVFDRAATSYQPNYYTSPDESIVLNSLINKTNAPTRIDMNILKSDYERNLWKGKLALGAKFAKVVTDNQFSFWDVINNTDILNKDRTNHFKYLEQVIAGYVNYNRNVTEKLSFQVGLRVENTHSLGELLQETMKPENRVERDYTNLFPSGALTWNVNKNNSFNLTYSRRIDRPSYQDLNPFEFKLDELTYQKGNPFLKPQYTNNLELTHSFMQAFNTTANYSVTTDMFSELIDTTESNKTFVTNRNFNKMTSYGLSINAPLPIAKWWEGFINVWVNNNLFDAKIREDYVIKTSALAYGFYSEQTFKLPKQFTVQVSGWYNGPSIWGGVWRSLSQGALDIGVEKKLWDKKASVKVTLTDVFRTNSWRSIADLNKGLYMKGFNTWESHQLRINFSYRFGNSKVKAARNRKTGIEDEKNRIKG